MSIAIKSTKVFTTVAASLLAVTVLSTSFSATAEAGKRERIIGGVVGGIIGGALVAGAARDRYYEEPRTYYRPVRRSHRPVYRSRGLSHVERCYRAYRSYNEHTDTFIGYDGIERRCLK